MQKRTSSVTDMSYEEYVHEQAHHERKYSIISQDSHQNLYQTLNGTMLMDQTLDIDPEDDILFTRLVVRIILIFATWLGFQELLRPKLEKFVDDSSERVRLSFE